MHGENDNRNNNGIDIGKTAVAIEYVPGEAAPKILATGKGVIADKIIERAKESNVPTYKDDKLADTLSRLKIGDMIPTELYEGDAMQISNLVSQYNNSVTNGEQILAR